MQSKLHAHNRFPVEVWWKCFGHLEPADKLVLRLVSSSFNALILHQVYQEYHPTIFRNAAKFADLSTLMDLFEYRQTCLKEAFRESAINGHLSITKQIFLWEPVPEDLISSEIFQIVCEKGHLGVLNEIYHHSTSKQELLISSDLNGAFAGFRLACANGHLSVVKQLHEWSNTPEEMVKANEFGCFRWSCMNGHLDVLLQLHEWYPNREMIEAKKSGGFLWSCRYGHGTIVKQIWDWMCRDIEMRKIGEKEARKFGHFDICQIFSGL
jgi:hypothetical protein